MGANSDRTRDGKVLKVKYQRLNINKKLKDDRLKTSIFKILVM